jgi:hypothetical protein
MPTNPIDFGKGVLEDLRSGDVYVDKGGNLVTIEDVSLALQECIVALKTIIGEEAFDADWGLDLFGIIKNPFLVEPTILITNAVMACLDPSKIPYIDEVLVTKVEQSDEEDGSLTYYVDVNITTLNGNRIQLTTDMGE